MALLTPYILLVRPQQDGRVTAPAPASETMGRGDERAYRPYLLRAGRALRAAGALQPSSLEATVPAVPPARRRLWRPAALSALIKPALPYLF